MYKYHYTLEREKAIVVMLPLDSDFLLFIFLGFFYISLNPSHMPHSHLNELEFDRKIIPSSSSVASKSFLF